MKRYIVLLVIVLGCQCHVASAFSTSLPDKPTQLFGTHVWHSYYQDMIVNGQVVQQGSVKDLEKKYEHIKKRIAKYKRPVTVVDLGASQGYYSLRLAMDFPDSVFVMIEEDLFLKRICMMNDQLHNIIFLHKKVTPQELLRLGSCEHFDVVLALNIIHWSLADWRSTADAIIGLGDTIIVETPPAEETTAIGGTYLEAINGYCLEQGAEIIDRFPRNHTKPDLLSYFYLIQHKKKGIDIPVWFAHEVHTKYQIKSTFKEKQLKKTVKQGKEKEQFESVWVPGINLMTFIALNGVYPEKDTLMNALQTLDRDGTVHKVPGIENLLIQGDIVVPVQTLGGTISSEPLNEEVAMQWDVIVSSNE